MEIDKKQKIVIGSIVVIGMVLPTVLFSILLAKIRSEREREELEEQELKKAESINDYDEYVRPTGYKSKRFNVFQARTS